MTWTSVSLSLIEGVGLAIAIALATDGHWITASLLGGFIVMLAYTEGRRGWGQGT